jgi:lycopene beta-cyclase
MKHYDYLMLGGGAAGLGLAFALVNSQLSDRKILIVDKDSKTSNDRTWSFWTPSPTPFDRMAFRVWDSLEFKSPGFQKCFQLEPYHYQTIRGIDYYRSIRAELAKFPNVHLMQGMVTDVQDGSKAARVRIDEQEFQADWVFDSRVIPEEIRQEPDRYRYLKQHFVGWEIETETAVFNPSAATLFDLRTEQVEGLCFFYILPFSERRAIVEYTLFSANLLPQEAYEQALKGYIEGQLGVSQYQILDQEQGVIPMTNHPFPRRLGKAHHGNRDARGASKAFHRLRFCSHPKGLASHCPLAGVEGTSLFRAGFIPRRKFYDALMLEVIAAQGDQVRPIMTAMFKNNSIQSIFRFLDEESSILEDIRMLASLPPGPFLRALRNWAWRQRAFLTRRSEHV